MGVYKLSGAGSLLTPRVNYTSMLAGNEAHVGPGEFDLIQSQIVSGSSTSIITFSNLAALSSAYRQLQIRAVARFSTSAQNEIGLNVRLNGDTAANYAIHGMFGLNSTRSSYGATSATQIPVGNFATAQTASNIYGAVVFDILDAYSTTKNKTIRAYNGFSDLATASLRSGLWLNTAGITSISLQDTALNSNFVAGSRISLYGIKG